jgi:murein tripeptide amidase MpaA
MPAMPLIMNTTEVESALVYFENTYRDLCRRIELPHKTYEKRSCYALQIGKDHDRRKPAILVIGGVHAREWGGPDIVVNFAGDLLRAYSRGKGLRYKKKTFPASDIKTIVETRTVVVFPCVNPDGVEYSHTKEHLWRKNRNRANSGDREEKIGVDINRNYDFLWDFKKYFHPSVCKDGDPASADPEEETYHGPHPFSEPETCNVKWLMDNFEFSLFLDLHSFDGDVLYSWGDDEDQSIDPAQNFANPAYDKKRGRGNDSYREYIGLADYTIATSIALQVSEAMKAARDRPYRPKQAFAMYPTCGTSDDYAFSRHMVEPHLAKTYGFTIEFNFGRDDDDGKFLITANPKVLERTMTDVLPGLLAFCLAAEQTRLFADRGAPRESSLVAPAMAQVERYRTGAGRTISRLIDAYETVASVAGPEGKAARDSLLKAIRAAAERAAKRGVTSS